MALCYVIARKLNPVNWNEIHNALNPVGKHYVSLFPIPDTLHIPDNCIGITVSGQYANNIREVKAELFVVFKLLWSFGFLISDVYTGEVITEEEQDMILGYL